MEVHDPIVVPTEDCVVCSALEEVLCIERHHPPMKEVDLKLDEVSDHCPGHSSLIATCVKKIWPVELGALEPSARIKIFRSNENMLFVRIHPEGEHMYGKNNGIATLLRLPDNHVDLEAELSAGGEFARTVNLSWLDRDLLKGWKSECENEHHETCGTSNLDAFTKEQRPTWLLDVVEDRLCRAHHTSEYAALSYVWGTTAFMTTTTENIEHLQEKGALLAFMTSHQLPRTIRDAITLVRSLGLKFLWVDALCIVQDDPIQKHRDIANMAGIYANASFSIVAMQGEEADSGLQGISAPRTYPYPEVAVRGRKTCIIKKTMSRSRKPSVWVNRGWTYQESLLSRRGFVFHDGTISWQCETSLREECLVVAKAERTSISSLFRRFLLSPSKERLNPCSTLQTLIQEYNVRSLSFPEDALFAFHGVFSMMRKYFIGGFISGLPTAFFTAALLWDVNSPYKLTPCVRRLAKRSTSEACLPSWSWAGWTCDTFLRLWPEGPGSSMAPWQAHRYNIQPLVTWHYHLSLDGEAIPINSLWYTYDGLYFDKDDNACPPQWTRSVSRLKPVKHLRPGFLYHLQEDMSRAWPYPTPFPTPEEYTTSNANIMAPYISCTTRRGWLFIEQGPTNKADPLDCRLQDTGGRRVGKLRPHPVAEEWRKLRKGSSCELIEIARGYSFNDPTEIHEKIFLHASRDDGNDNLDGAIAVETYYVMYIKWENGIAYRRGIGEVRKDLWDEQDLDLIPVTLG